MLKKIAMMMVLVGPAFITGCASNASSDQMTYHYTGSGMPANASLVHGIKLTEVSGGTETNPLWVSKVDNAGFTQALIASLKEAHLYTKLAQGRYQLDAKLVNLKQPMLGLNLKVTCQAQYRLTSSKTHKMIYNKNITTSYVAKFKDSPIASMRLKKANEGAVRMNIQKFIDSVYHLS